MLLPFLLHRGTARREARLSSRAPPARPRHGWTRFDMMVRAPKDRGPIVVVFVGITPSVGLAQALGLPSPLLDSHGNSGQNAS